ncbi:MAG: hypothetical protein JSW59_20745, partial [Phycisphaerales bacterium]
IWNSRGFSWSKTLLMREHRNGQWQIAGLFSREHGVNLEAVGDYLNPWSPAIHPAWGETTEYRISADDLARGCYIDFDKRKLHRMTPGSNLTRATCARLGLDGKCGSHEVSGDGGLIGIDLLARSGHFIWGLITPLNVQLASSLWMDLGSSVGGSYIIKTREGGIGVMGVSGDVNNYYIKFKMLNPACLGSAGTIFRAVQADPRETAAYFLTAVLCRHGELDVGSVAQNSELVAKARSYGRSFGWVRLETVYANNSVALAVTSKSSQDEYRRLVLRLSSREGDRWLVTDVQIETKSQDGEALRNFLKEYPDARIFPSAVRVERTVDDDIVAAVKTITRDNLFEVARSSNYKVGPEWFQVAESPHNRIYESLERHAERSGEPRFNEVLDDWVRWKYDLDAVVDTDSAMAQFETFCDQFDSGKEFFADDPKARAIGLICDKLDANELMDRYVAALSSGRSFYSGWTVHSAFSIDERKYTVHERADVLPASISAVWHALLRIDELLDRRHPASRNIIEDRLTPILIEDYEKRERQSALDNAVLLGGPAIAEFLLQKDWRDEQGSDNLETVGSPPRRVNKWLLRLINLDDPAGEKFRAEHRDIVFKFANTWAESSMELDQFDPPSFLLFDRNKGRDSFAWRYWPAFSDKTDGATSTRQPLTFKLKRKFSYLKILEPFTTTQMYFDCWVWALDELENYYLEVRTVLGQLPAHRKHTLAEMMLEEVNGRLEKVGPGTEENHNVWSRLVFHRTVLSGFLNEQ